MTLDERQTISVGEAAKVLGVSRPVAYAAVHAGQIPSLHIGRRLLVPVPRLRALLEGEAARDDETPS